MTELQQATLVEILPTRIWIESDMMGARHVMLQHEGMQPFTYASFHYDYAYTSNGGTWAAAHSLGLGATEPVEARNREFKLPTVDEIRAQIKVMTAQLASMEEGDGQ